MVHVGRLTRQIREHTKSALLAGGMGTRLKALTDDSLFKGAIPKPCIRVGNMRIIEFSTRAFANAGINEINVLTCRMPDAIWKVLHNPKVFGENVEFKESVEHPNEPLGTAGAVGKLVKEKGYTANPDDIVVILSADIVHNVDLKAVIDAHLYNREHHNAAATIVVNPVKWDVVHELGTVKLKGMPDRIKDRDKYKGPIEYEDAVAKWLNKHSHEGTHSMPIEGFSEKKFRSIDQAREILQKRGNGEHEQPMGFYESQLSYSNLNNSSIYVINASFFNTILEKLTTRIMTRTEPGAWAVSGHKLLFGDNQAAAKEWSDWGKHIFPWMVEESNRQQFPLFAYVLPETEYWRDCGRPEDVIQAMMDALQGKVETGLKEAVGQYWFPIGNNSFCGFNVSIPAGVQITNSLICDGVELRPGVTEISGSVIGSGTVIESGVTMMETLVQDRRWDFPTLNIVRAGTSTHQAIIAGGIVGGEKMTLNAEIFYDKAGTMGESSFGGKG
jgi:NDP-sugar pyrophosphorylase family protein